MCTILSYIYRLVLGSNRFKAIVRFDTVHQRNVREEIEWQSLKRNCWFLFEGHSKKYTTPDPQQAAGLRYIRNAIHLNCAFKQLHRLKSTLVNHASCNIGSSYGSPKPGIFTLSFLRNVLIYKFLCLLFSFFFYS